MERIAGTPRQIAERLRARVREEVGLPITVGIASTKFLAKVASAVGKPDGLLVVPAGEELEFLHALPVERLWGVGPATSRKLHAYGIRRVAEVAALDEPTLVEMLGRAAGRKLHALAHNRDPRRVQARARRRSIGAQNAFGWRPRHRSEAELDAVLVGLVDRVGRRMRKANRACRTVTLRLRFDDLARVTRSRTLPEATAETPAILVAARTLLRDALPMLARAGMHDGGDLALRARGPRRDPARARLRGRRAAGARRRAGRRARALRLGVDHARRPARQGSGHHPAAVAR